MTRGNAVNCNSQWRSTAIHAELEPMSDFVLRGRSFPSAPGHTCPRSIAPKSESFASKSFRHSDITLVFKTTFAVFTRVGPDNSLECLTERSVGLITDRPSDVYEL